MQTASDEISRPQAKTFASMVAPQFRKDVHLDGLDYQTGIRATVVWPNKQQCLRVIPGYDTATGEVYSQLKPGMPYVMDYDPADYLSESFFRLRTISGLGESRSTVITSYRPGSEESQRWAGNTVIHWFAADVAKAVRSQDEGKAFHLTAAPEWSRWVTYDAINKKMPILPFDRETLLFQALVWTLNGRGNRIKVGDAYQDLVDSNGNALPLVSLIGIDNSNSLKEFYKALIEPLDPSKPLDGLNNSRYHGIAEQDGSILFLLPGQVTQKDKKQNVLQPHVSDDPSNWNVTPYPLTDEQIHSWWQPWDQLLNFMTPAEQCELLASEFGADTVNYVIGSCYALQGLEIPESVAKAGLGRYAAYQRKQASGAPSGFGTAKPSFGAPQQQPARPAFGQPTQPAARPVAQPRPAFGKPAAQTPAPAAQTARPAFGGLKPNGPDVMAEMSKMAAAGVKLAQPARQDTMAALAQDLVGDVDYGDDNVLLPGLED